MSPAGFEPAIPASERPLGSARVVIYECISDVAECETEHTQPFCFLRYSELARKKL
jgi:hypothetical protein